MLSCGRGSVNSEEREQYLGDRQPTIQHPQERRDIRLEFEGVVEEAEKKDEEVAELVARNVGGALGVGRKQPKKGRDKATCSQLHL